MQIEERISYLGGLFEQIKANTVDSWRLAYSEFTTWCTILSNDRTITPAQLERVTLLKTSFTNYTTQLEQNLNELRKYRKLLEN